MQLIKKSYNAIDKYFSSPKAIRILQALAFLSLAGLAIHVNADDLLKGTETNLIETVSKTGKRYLYIAEGITAVVAGIMSKNWLVLGGVVVVAIFINIVITMANAVVV